MRMTALPRYEKAGHKIQNSCIRQGLYQIVDKLRIDAERLLDFEDSGLLSTFLDYMRAAGADLAASWSLAPIRSGPRHLLYPRFTAIRHDTSSCHN